MVKKFVLFVVIGLFLSCSAAKKEKQVVDDFLKTQLSHKKYVPYKSFDILLIENAGTGMEAVLSYEHTLNNNYGYPATTNWVLDSARIKDLKTRLSGKASYEWKQTDLETISYRLISWDTITKNIRRQRYTNNLMLSISRPVLLDRKRALLHFYSGVTDVRFRTLDRFGALLKKEGSEWKISDYYYDEVYD